MATKLELEKQIAELQRQLAQVKESAKEEGTKETARKTRKSKIDDSELIEVRSLCSGTLTVQTKLDTYQFLEKGAIEEITFGELRKLKNEHPKYFEMIVVEDEEVCKELRLDYSKLNKISDVKKFFTKATAEEADELFKDLPQFQRMEIINDLIELWKNGDFRDLATRDYIQSRFDINIEAEAMYLTDLEEVNM